MFTSVLLKLGQDVDTFSTNHWWVLLIIGLVGCCICGFGILCQCNVMICTHTMLCCCCLPMRLRPRWARKRRKAFAQQLACTEEEEQIQLVDTRRLKAAETVEKLRQQLEEAEALYQVNTEIFGLLTARSITGVKLDFEEIDTMVREKLYEAEEKMLEKEEKTRLAGYKDLENVQKDALDATKKYVGQLTARGDLPKDPNLEEKENLLGENGSPLTKRSSAVKSVISTLLGRKQNCNIIDADGNVIKGGASTGLVAPAPGPSLFSDDEEAQPGFLDRISGSNMIVPLGANGLPINPKDPQDANMFFGNTPDGGGAPQTSARKKGIISTLADRLTGRSTADIKIAPGPVEMEEGASGGEKAVSFGKNTMILPKPDSVSAAPALPVVMRNISSDSDDAETPVKTQSRRRKERSGGPPLGTGMTSDTPAVPFLPLADDNQILARMEEAKAKKEAQGGLPVSEEFASKISKKSKKKSAKKSKGVVMKEEDDDEALVGIKLPSIPKLDFARVNAMGMGGRMPFN